MDWDGFRLQVQKQETISASYAECDDLIDQFRSNRLPLMAGCDLEGSLEAKVTGVLNNIRETASKVPPSKCIPPISTAFSPEVDLVGMQLICPICRGLQPQNYECAVQKWSSQHWA